MEDIMRKLKINTIQSVEKAITILNVLTSEKEWMSIDELVAQTSFSKTTTYRLLYTLEKYGLIRYDPVVSKYYLGYKLLEYGDAITSSQDILQESEFLLLQLYKDIKQTVLLGVIDDESLVYIFKREKITEGLTLTSSIGRKRSLFYGALGRVALAFLPDHKKEKLLNKTLPAWTPKTITDKNQLMIELDKIQKEHVCVESDEAATGVTGIASPVFGFHGEIIAVLGVLCLTNQTNEETIQYIKQQVKDTAEDISRNMGYLGNTET